MNIKSLLLIAASAATLQASAQVEPWTTDTLVMGTGYANTVFHRMDRGVVKTEANNNWEIAFVAPGLGRSVSAIANHAAGVNVYSLHLSAAAKFGQDLTSDTIGKVNNALYNDLTTWQVGAFNMNASGFPSYGWGSYDMITHNITGDSIYLVTTPSGHYQLWIEKFTSAGANMGWDFHVAKIDGTDKMDKNVLTSAYADKMFAYYHIGDDAFVDREPKNIEWDIMLTRYSEEVMPGMYYPVTGILNNEALHVAKLENVEADTAMYHDYPMDTVNNSIGRAWKKSTYSPAGFYDLDTITYFIESKNTNIYQMEVLFATTGGAPAPVPPAGLEGAVSLRRRMVKFNGFPTNVNEVAKKETSLNIYPNPAGTEANLILNNVTAARAQLFVSDMAGRTVLRSTVNLKDGLNALKLNTSAYPAGTYIINVISGQNKMTQKLNVQH